MWVRMLIEQHPDRKYSYLHIYLKMFTKSNIFFNVQVTAFFLKSKVRWQSLSEKASLFKIKFIRKAPVFTIKFIRKASVFTIKFHADNFPKFSVIRDVIPARCGHLGFKFPRVFRFESVGLVESRQALLEAAIIAQFQTQVSTIHHLQQSCRS